MNILIKLSGIENKEELITGIKKEALDSSSSFEFYLDCPSSEFTKFEGFDKIHRFQNDGVALSAVIQKKEETDGPILYPLNSLNDKPSYLFVLNKEKDSVAEKRISTFYSFVKEDSLTISLFSNSLFSEGYPNKENWNKESVTELFTKENSFSVLNQYDFQLLSDAFLTIKAFKKKEKESKKTLFSDVGNYFFKNYMSHPKDLTRELMLSSYGRTWKEEVLYFQITKKGTRKEYLSLFRLRKLYQKNHLTILK